MKMKPFRLKERNVALLFMLEPDSSAELKQEALNSFGDLINEKTLSALIERISEALDREAAKHLNQ